MKTMNEILDALRVVESVAYQVGHKQELAAKRIKDARHGLPHRKTDRAKQRELSQAAFLLLGASTTCRAIIDAMEIASARADAKQASHPKTNGGATSVTAAQPSLGL